MLSQIVHDKNKSKLFTFSIPNCYEVDYYFEFIDNGEDEVACKTHVVSRRTIYDGDNYYEKVELKYLSHLWENEGYKEKRTAFIQERLMRGRNKDVVYASTSSCTIELNECGSGTETTPYDEWDQRNGTGDVQVDYWDNLKTNDPTFPMPYIPNEFPDVPTYIPDIPVFEEPHYPMEVSIERLEQYRIEQMLKLLDFTEEELSSICLSYRHDYGMLPIDEEDMKLRKSSTINPILFSNDTQKNVMFDIKETIYAIKKEIMWKMEKIENENVKG